MNNKPINQLKQTITIKNTKKINNITSKEQNIICYLEKSITKPDITRI